MTKFALRRGGVAVGLLLILLLVLFVLSHLSDSDPAAAYLGAKASPDQIAQVRHRLGLDRPLLEQYFRYVGHAVQGDLGTSLRTRRGVAGDLWHFFPATLELVFAAFVLAALLGAGYAFSGALRVRGTGPLRGVLLVFASAPAFLVGLLGIVLFYSELGWLPAAGRGADTSTPTGFMLLDSLLHADPGQFGAALRHLLLPALTLAIAPAIAIGRILRSSIETTLRADHVRTARAKGVTEAGVLGRHVVRNALGPALSMSGLQLGAMFAGVVVVEKIFSWPGIGSYLSDSIASADFPAIAGVTLLLGAIYIVANALVDVLQTVADPRLAL
ncbi:ABC transporter permease [Pseudofrankia saprophytica]|uniref:ABC transporter permease n=1 Tax=Pseudofrankia saprophytica TaxID=298655 RepID=UPI000234B4AC|nr:ABC transporter permease [Pseudofrankia saprophytica]